MNNIIQLGEEKIIILLIKYSLPVIIGALISALYNFIDRIFIGNSAGALGIAGITIGFPIMIIMYACTMLIATGATSLVSIKLGEQKVDEAERVIGNAMVLLIIISIIITISGLLFLNSILKTFGASSEVLPYAKDYMGIILLGTIFQLLGLGMNNFIRAEGSPKKAMATILIGVLLNAILAPIFIFGFKLGMKGAALATIISQAVSATWVMSHFLCGKSFLKIRIKNLKLRADIIEKILAIGLSFFTMQIAVSLVNVIMNNSLAQYGGDIAVSGMGVVTSISILLILPIIGISQGVQPIIGFNYGAKKIDRVKEALKISVIAATVIATLGFITTRVFSEQLMVIFSSENKEFIAFGSYGMRIFLICLPILGFQIIGSGYFQAIGKPKQAMFLTLSRQVFFLIPALHILPKTFQIMGVLISFPISDFISSIITGICLLMELKKLNQKQQENISRFSILGKEN